MLVDSSNRQITLGKQLGNRGGEGSVYEVVGRPDLVAKKYHFLPDARKVEKLRTQIALSNQEICSFSAWPIDLLKERGSVVGFLMPRVDGLEIRRLYRVPERYSDFPDTTWKDLVNVARNLAAAFHFLHKNNILMGDVNELNIFVTRKGEVRLIDCDSYQISSPNGTVYLCEVGIVDWTAPEIQGKRFSNLVRSESHDLFGLALMIFHVLFMGRHPFAGVPKSDALLENLPPLEECIQKYQFVYSRKGGIDYEPPPHSLPLNTLPDNIAALFEQAFLTTNRPTASQWYHELGTIPFQKCRWGHVFYRNLTECPWCRIWLSGGHNFFIVRGTFESGSSYIGELEKILEEIKRVTFLSLRDKVFTSLELYTPVTFSLPSIKQIVIPECQPTPFPPVPRFRKGYIVDWLIFWFSILIFLLPTPITILVGITGLVISIRGIKRGPENPEYVREIENRISRPRIIYSEIQQFLEDFKTAQDSQVSQFYRQREQFCDELKVVWLRSESEFKSALSALQTDAANLLKRYRELPNIRREMRLKKMESSQKEEFLASIRLNQYKIPQIGPVRARRLAGYGVFTALDVKKMRYIHGLGGGYFSLQRWLERMEQRFRFNPSRPLSAAGEQELRREMSKIEDELKQQFHKIQERWINFKMKSSPEQLRARFQTMIEGYQSKLKGLNCSINEHFISSEKKLSEIVLNYGQALADLSEILTGRF